MYKLRTKEMIEKTGALKVTNIQDIYEYTYENQDLLIKEKQMLLKKGTFFSCLIENELHNNEHVFKVSFTRKGFLKPVITKKSNRKLYETITGQICCSYFSSEYM